MEQIITINQDGSMETLRQKKGQGVDLREFGPVQMERVSEVILDSASQQYFVRFLSGPLAGRELSVGLHAAIAGKDFPVARMKDRALFDEYEDGVEAEIQTINYLTLNEAFVPQAVYFCPESRLD